MIQLEKRKEPSTFWIYATPVLAVFLTMVLGGLLFATLGKDPLMAIKTILSDGKKAYTIAIIRRTIDNANNKL